MSGLSLVDGSGLSRKNFITTEFITSLLIKNTKKPWLIGWRDSLPQIDGGTLSYHETYSQGTLKGRLQDLPNNIKIYAAGSMRVFHPYQDTYAMIKIKVISFQ